MITGSPDARERFTNRVRDYVRFRPSYPSELIELLKQRVSDGAVVADIGSGTGILSRLLLEAGFVVHAVEPNPAMRHEAEVSLQGIPGFFSVEGEGERTTLPDRSVHAVTVAQAFHWFATKNAVAEFTRILAPEGHIFLIWNDRKTECDAFHREYEALLVQYGTDYTRIDHRNITEAVVLDLFEGWSCKTTRMENHQELDLAALLGRLESSSYCPPKDHPDYTALTLATKSLFDRESTNGMIRMSYECVTYSLKRIEQT